MLLDITRIEYDKIIGQHMAGGEKNIIPDSIEYTVIPYDNCKELKLTIKGPTVYGRTGYSKIYSYFLPYSQFDIYGKIKKGKTSNYSYDGKTIKLYNSFDIIQPIEDDNENHFIQTDKLNIDLIDGDLQKPSIIKGYSSRIEIKPSNWIFDICMYSKISLPYFKSSFRIKNKDY